MWRWADNESHINLALYYTVYVVFYRKRGRTKEIFLISKASWSMVSEIPFFGWLLSYKGVNSSQSLRAAGGVSADERAKAFNLFLITFYTLSNFVSSR